MTPFERTIIYLLIIIVILLGFIAFCVWNHYRDVEYSNYMLRKKLDNIDTNTATSVSVAQDISQQLDNIEDNILDDLRDIRLADKLGKTSPNVQTTLPCYSPNGICMNPHMDCINCPKRVTGGIWTTSTNLNKED